MTTQQAIRRYPCLMRVLMAIAETSDVTWAAAVVIRAREDNTGLAHQLASEAWQYRGKYKAQRSGYSGTGESDLTSSLPNQAA